MSSSVFFALKYASDILKSDKDIVLAALNNSKDSDILMYFDDKFRDDEDVMLLALSKGSYDVEFLLSDRLRDNEIFLLKCLNEKNITIPVVCLSDRLRSDKFFASKYATGRSLKYFSPDLCCDKETVLQISKKSGINLYDLPDNLRKDYDIIKVAIEFDSNVYDKLDWKIKNDPYIIKIYEISKLKKIKKILDESIHIDNEILSNYFNSISFEYLSCCRNLEMFYFGEKAITNLNDEKFKVAIVTDLMINFSSLNSELVKNILGLIRIDKKIANSNICGVQLIVLARYLNNEIVESILLENGALDLNYEINDDVRTIIENIVSMYKNASVEKQNTNNEKKSDSWRGSRSSRQ